MNRDRVLDAILAFHRDERGFLAAIGAILAKAVPIITAVAGGYNIYQSIQAEAQRKGQALPAPVNVPMLPSEISRRQVAITRYGPGPAYGGTVGRIAGAIEPAYPGQEAIYDMGGQFVGFRRRRHMNVLNPRALNRSIRRVKGFSKFAMRVGRYTNPGKSYKLKGFARKRKR